MTRCRQATAAVWHHRVKHRQRMNPPGLWGLMAVAAAELAVSQLCVLEPLCLSPGTPPAVAQEHQGSDQVLPGVNHRPVRQLINLNPPRELTATPSGPKGGATSSRHRQREL